MSGRSAAIPIKSPGCRTCLATLSTVGRASTLLLLLLARQQARSEQSFDAAVAPRIVNIYNFIRNSDYRLENSEPYLYDTTRQQVELFRKHQLPVTWALQYDALINPKYQELLKEQAGPRDEIGGWWELPRALVDKAGIEWRGDHDWVSTANIAFSPGYSPSDRKKLVDVYMAEFRRVFGYYPRSVGSWYIDEVTLAYMAEKYGVVASCNCKDQVGTDGYTLWGGYWNQAYYPSRVNAYMPAQTEAEQIKIPVFRMLGSDPIYQYGRANFISSLEPVYGESGGSRKWVTWFMDCLVHEPCLAFAYTQAGQENSFGWNAMHRGLEMQAEYLASLSKAGKIRIETLAENGEWFRERFPLTPPTAVVCLKDWRNEGRRAVWYNSRFYRVNLFWDKDGMIIRDLHKFDESRPCVMHDRALETSTMSFGTLPIIEGVQPFAETTAGAIPVRVSTAGQTTRLTTSESPTVSQPSDFELVVSQPVTGGTLIIHCKETQLLLELATADGEIANWKLQLQGQRHECVSMTVKEATLGSELGPFQVRLAPDCGSFVHQADGQISVEAGPSGRISLILADE